MKSSLMIATRETADLGLVGIAVSESGLRALRMFLDGPEDFQLEVESLGLGPVKHDPDRVAPYFAQIDRYLAGQMQTFSFPLDLKDLTEFQKQVLRETVRIPYGETRSYGEIAARIGNPRAARAVGQAERRNPIPLVIPCHRVIGSDGSLTGYGGNQETDTKAWLLAFERDHRTA